MNLKINFIILVLFFLSSCTLQSVNPIIDSKIEKKNYLTKTKKNENLFEIEKNDNQIEKIQIVQQNTKTPFYLIGDPYFIEGVQYIPEENYNYNENGLATFYGPELHKKRTVNNSLNNVTELLGRHKTLPLPSLVKIINLENGLSLLIKINDRNEDNTSIIQVSRKVAQLLRFYKSGIARVNIQIIPDPSKQLKIVTNSMNSSEFNTTIQSAPTEKVTIVDLGETDEQLREINVQIEQPIELGLEEIYEKQLFVFVQDLFTYEDAKNLIKSIETKYKSTTQNEGEKYSILFGPIENQEANKLVLTLIARGYKNTKIIIK